MNIQDYVSREPGGRKILAAACGVSIANVYQWSKGLRPVPAKHCARIEIATGGLVTRKDLRTDWSDIWPELKESA